MLTSKSVLCFGILFISFAFVFQLFGGTSTAGSLEAKLVKEAQQFSHKVEDTAKNLFVKMSFQATTSAMDSIGKYMLKPVKTVYEFVEPKVEEKFGEGKDWFGAMQPKALQKFDEMKDRMESTFDKLKLFIHNTPRSLTNDVVQGAKKFTHVVEDSAKKLYRE
ncbi:uncharacterized protein LOC103518867, partial [Diaphorina citri]|uniref:Uncharacterized protein LOC103518867 n=1 Tax=Diaphorina citri TaxID=121845 RepID=A0A1S4EMP7_DIACI